MVLKMFLILLHVILMLNVVAGKEGIKGFDEVIVDHEQKILQGFRAASDSNMEKKDENESNALTNPSRDDEMNDFEENIEEMTLNTWNMTGQTDDTDDALVFSNLKDSGMETFDEDVLEEELREADVRPGHTPWSLIGMGVGGGVLVVVVVGMVVAGVVMWKKKKNTSKGVADGGSCEA